MSIQDKCTFCQIKICESEIFVASAIRTRSATPVFCPPLPYMRQPQDQDRERIRVICAKKDEAMRLVAVQVLWMWKDVKTLLELRAQCDDGYVRDEIQRVLDSLGKS